MGSDDASIPFSNKKITKSKRKSCSTLQIFCFTSLILTTCYLTSIYFFRYASDSLPAFRTAEVLFGEKTSSHRVPVEAELPSPPPPPVAKCDVIDNNQKFDCHPQTGANQKACEERGCCWAEPKEDINLTVTNVNTTISVPHCYYPKDYALYKFVNLTVADFGATGYMKAVYSSPYPKDKQILKIDIKYETETRLHIKIYDPVIKRYEPPYPEVPIMESAAKNIQYQVDIDKNKIGFTVVRKSDNKSIFDCLNVGGFTYADQFLQLSAKLPTNFIYGLGEHRTNFLLDTNWQSLTFFNHDQPPTAQSNLYGSHPFYLAVEPNGKSSGVLLLNSNAMDIILQPSPAVTYRTIGGILDFYFFIGPTPSDVIEQFTELVGRPIIPPYWSLGFHLCRFGYNSLNNTKDILEKNQAVGIPLDVQWNDIDYMDKRNDFTYDTVNYKGLRKFVDNLHKDGLHYVVIMDPGISASEPKGTYPPYDEAIADDILVKDHTGQNPIIGKVWNRNLTAFPDFTNPKTVKYWINQISRQQREQFKYDGLWIDMNEPSNFVDGSVSGCPDDPLENPPYVPGVVGGKLTSHTLCMTAKHYIGQHYDVHNIFGLSEAVVTSFALTQITNKRPFVISRSTFVGQGKYSGTWTGDNYATWNDMYQSISDILNMNIFGIPLVGADICGFQKNTTVQLCQRWHQLGAFYPFSRNHNSIDCDAQDPVSLGTDVVNSARKALIIRYTLLPYLYTLFWQAHIKGDTVARPLFFEFPSDAETYKIDKQFLWGPALHIIPVLTEGMSYVKGYLPKSRWFDYYSGKEIINKNVYITFPAPADTIPLLIRGGYILPTQIPAATTTLSRKNKFGLLVAPDEKNEASGLLFWDDGESIETYERSQYNCLKFNLTGQKLSCTVDTWKYETDMILGSVDILGVKSVTSVVVNGTDYKNFTHKADSQYLQINNLTLNMKSKFSIAWS